MMSRAWLAAAFAALAFYLVGVISFYQVGSIGFPTVAFWAGGNMFMIAGLSLLAMYKPPGIRIKLLLLCVSIIFFAFSTTSFLYSYFVGGFDLLPYVGMALACFGTTGTFLAARRIPKTNGPSQGSSLANSKERAVES